jgi:hypothetical protein
MILLWQIPNTVLVYKRFDKIINYGRNGDAIEMAGTLCLLQVEALHITAGGFNRLQLDSRVSTILYHANLRDFNVAGTDRLPKHAQEIL